MGDENPKFTWGHIQLDQFLESLANAPVVEVLGIVNSVQGYDWPDGTLRLLIELSVWRFPDGEVASTKMRCRRKIEHQEFSRLEEIIKPGMVVQFRVRPEEDQSDETVNALFEEFMASINGDALLESQLAELRKPQMHEVPELGVFTLDRSMGCWETEATWCGQAVSVRVDHENRASHDDRFRAATVLWQNQQSWNQRVRQFAVQTLLPLKNENWLDEGEEEVTASEFDNAISLATICTQPDDCFEFWFDDGEIFLGHGILVSGNLADGPLEANLVG